jgi:glycosyltransferase involved in cell wall biosynthesis
LNTQPHILFISYDGLTDPLGQSQILPYLAGLAKSGYRFTVLSCEKPERFKKNQSYVESLISTYPITWVPIAYHKKPAVLSSIYDVWTMKKKSIVLFKEYKFDMVHTRAGLPALVGLWLKRKTGIKFLHDIREFYADGRIDGGIWDIKKFYYRSIYKYFKKKEVEEIKNCDGIVCLTNAAEKIINSLPEYNAGIPLQVIPCSVDTDLFDPGKIKRDDQVALQKKLGISPGDFVISYLGSLGSWYMINEMLQLFKKIADKIPASKILFITPHSREEISVVATRNFIPEERVISVQARRNEVPMCLSLSNYSIFFIKPCYSKLSSSPTKHGEIMAMGIPLVTNAGGGDVEQIVNDTSSGIILSEMNENEFALVADKIFESSEKIKNQDFDRLIVAGAKKYYSLENAIEKYRRLYDQILK